MSKRTTLVVGEVFVDFSLPTTPGTPVKMRLGGIAHAARALWACETPYAVAAFCPAYLVDEARTFLEAHGCTEFILLGDVVGAPNIFVIGDAREVGDQGYENILRDAKKIVPISDHAPIHGFSNVILFPGAFDLSSVIDKLSKDAHITADIAYDVANFDTLIPYAGRFTSIATSTSSALFKQIASTDIGPLIDACHRLRASYLLLKENRGGSRLFDLALRSVEEIPAVLRETANSVGVGDAYTAVFGTAEGDASHGAWRGMQVATSYAQTTFPDDLKTDVQRQLSLPLETVKGLGGVVLPWHDRPNMQIYLAAPDFSYIPKPEIDVAVAALEYHNFVVRRPVVENGEAALGSTPAQLRRFYNADVDLLRHCSAIFAVPLQRDPGTLVEVGMAIDMRKPVITFDPRRENDNTMVICGSEGYSTDLDNCVNALFTALSFIRQHSQ